MPSLLFEPRIQLIDSNGDPIVNGYIYTYAAGTSTPKDTYDDYAATIVNPNPIRTGSDGRPASDINVYLSGAYKIDIHDENDVALPGYPVDNVISATDIDFTGLTASIADLNSTTTTSIAKAINYAIVLTDRGKTVLMDASSGSLNVNLLAATTAADGYRITIKKTDNSLNMVTIVPDGSETIDIRPQYILYDYNDFLEILCDGSNWKIVAAQIRGTIITVTGATVIDLEDNGHYYECDGSGGGFNMTLPPSATVGKGFVVSFKKTDATTNEITLVPDGAETIDGETTLILRTKNDTFGLKTDGADWFIINAVEGHSGFQTGDIKATYREVPESPGWVIMNDGTIGDSGSGATTRANADTKDLYVLFWNNVADAYAPVSTGRGASALDDFNAGKTLRFPLMDDRFIVQSVGAYALGQTGGNNTHVLTTAELAVHSHTLSGQFVGLKDAAPSAAGVTDVGTAGVSATDVTGSAAPHENRPPFSAVLIYVKL